MLMPFLLYYEIASVLAKAISREILRLGGAMGSKRLKMSRY